MDLRRSQNGRDRYALASITLHWLMLALLVAVYALIELRELFPKGSAPREAMKQWHFMLGLSVFGLVWIRVVARLIWPPPQATPGEPRWRHSAATAVHLALYVLMIGMPLAGWVVLSAEGKAIPFFGLDLPALAGPSRELAERAEDLHELGGTIGYWMIGLHASAALFHQFFLKDGLMARMLPLAPERC